MTWWVVALAFVIGFLLGWGIAYIGAKGYMKRMGWVE